MLSLTCNSRKTRTKSCIGMVSPNPVSHYSQVSHLKVFPDSYCFLLFCFLVPCLVVFPLNHVCSMFLPCSFHVPSVFLPCSFCVPSMFLLCSFHVPSVFLFLVPSD